MREEPTTPATTLAPHAPRPWVKDAHDPYVIQHAEGYLTLSVSPETSAFIVTAVNAYEPAQAEITALKAELERRDQGETADVVGNAIMDLMAKNANDALKLLDVLGSRIAALEKLAAPLVEALEKIEASKRAPDDHVVEVSVYDSFVENEVGRMCIGRSQKKFFVADIRAAFPETAP